jgi:hypothetical protein
MLRKPTKKKFIGFVVVVITIFKVIVHFKKSPKFDKEALSESSDDLTSLVDWSDSDFINYELRRNGPGERSGYNLTNVKDIELNEMLFKTEGLFLVVSDKISLDRSLPDPRPKE